MTANTDDRIKRNVGRPSLREKLLSDGLRLVHERGFGASSVRDIVQAAGVPLGSFTNHFASKEAFGLEVVERYREMTSAGVAATLRNDALPPLERLRGWIGRQLEYLRPDDMRRGCLYGNLSAEASEQSEAIRTRIAGVFLRESGVRRLLLARRGHGRRAPRRYGHARDRWFRRLVAPGRHPGGQGAKKPGASRTLRARSVLGGSRNPVKGEGMHRIGLVLVGGFQIMSSAAVAVFEIANILGGKQFYDVKVISEDGGNVRSSIGMVVETQPLSGVFDTLLVAGGIVIAPTRPRILALLRRAVSRSRRVASICTGAFVLAEAGILDGRRATTHWLHARELQARFPRVRVEEDRIFIKDGPVWTSAGMTAGIDLALAMVESDLGAEVAREVARGLVVYHRRGGGQSQFSTLLVLEPKSDPIQTALAHARQNLRSRLSVEELALAAHLSVRQFTRAFRAETGQTPARAVESLRLEVARVMLEEGTHSVEEVAEETGFGDRERMRRAFVRAFGRPPQVIRRFRHPGRRTGPNGSKGGINDLPA